MFMGIFTKYGNWELHESSNRNLRFSSRKSNKSIKHLESKNNERNVECGTNEREVKHPCQKEKKNEGLFLTALLMTFEVT